MPPLDDVNLRRLEQRLVSLQRAGVSHLPRRAALAAQHTAAAGEPAGCSSPSQEPSGGLAEPPAGGAAGRPVADVDLPLPSQASLPSRPGHGPTKHAALAALDQQVRVCTRCAQLAATRTQTVFGTGNPDSPVVFFGEAPGAEEDRRGQPFVGRAGELLNRMLAACGWEREQVYIMNVLKCRPPGNRTPTGQESLNCRPFFERQLEIIQPRYICCLGATAATTLLETQTPIGKLRGRLHAWRQSKVVATYHPAYLLRNPSAKRLAWEDLKLMLRDMGIPVPS